MHPFISICMIVKNEEAMLERSLDSVKETGAEIIIVDTGSTDNTKEIAKRYTDHVYDFEWVNDFSAARNYAASKATGTWILALDADECIDPETYEEAVKELKSFSNQFDFLFVSIINFTGVSGEGRTVLSRMARLYKNDGSVRYEQPLHEQLIKKEGEPRIAISSLNLYHYGYLKNVVIKHNKEERNLNILQQKVDKEGSKAFYHFNYGQELMRQDKVEQALSEFVEAYKHKANIEVGWVATCLSYIIQCLVSLKRYEKALQITHDAEMLWEQAPDFRLWRGDLYFMQQRYDDAREIYLKILDSDYRQSDIIYNFDSRDFLPHLRLGNIYESQKDYTKAMEHYTKARNYNPGSLEVLWNMIRLLLKFHTADEVFQFIHTNDLIRTDVMALELMKHILNIAQVELALRLEAEYLSKDRAASACVRLKASLVGEDFPSPEVLSFEMKDMMTGIHLAILDLADLFILYYLTKDERIEVIVSKSQFAQAFSFLFGDRKKVNKADYQWYISLIEKAIIFQKPEFVEELISYKKLFHKDIDAKIGDIFYRQGFEDIALTFYEAADENHMTRDGFVNVIEWLIARDEKEEAGRIAMLAMEKFKKDFRFYKYSIELDSSSAPAILKKGMKVFPDSVWLQKKAEQF